MVVVKDKVGVVMGVANDMSIAWGIAKAMHDNGAKVILTYQAEPLKKRVEPLAKQINADLHECNVTDPSSLELFVKNLEAQGVKLDFVVHSIAFSDKNELKGRFIDTSHSNFLNSMDVSVYSFISVTKALEPMLNDNASLLTLSYYGAEKAIPNYNVMGVCKAALEASVRYMANDLGARGIRVNCISSGPIRTLAAMAIGGFRSMLKAAEKINPLKRNTTIEDVGNTAVYLMSDLGSAVTGEVIHVDCGFHAVGISLESGEKEE